MRTRSSKKKRISRASSPRMKWAVTANHVYPLYDLRDHVPQDCWCYPTDDDGLIIHNSMDGRELYESGERKLS